MKSLLFFTLAFLSVSAKVYAQDQFVSQNLNHDMYEDAAYKVFLQSSGTFEFPMIITWDYANQSIQFIGEDGTEWLAATWKTEVNPDEIKGDENNRYLFDPAKNELKMKVLKVYVNIDGSFTYKIEADKQKIVITGIYWDMDSNGIADIAEGEAGDSENYGDADVHEGEINGATLYYLNLSNSTDYTIYLSTNVQTESGEWNLIDKWIVIEPGQSFMIGTTYAQFFYYYAYCIDSKGEFIIWEGEDQYNVVNNSDGSYGFRKVTLDQGAFDDNGEVWFMDLTL